MWIKYLFALVLFFSFLGCAKHENEPSTPVVNFYNAGAAGDSVGILNSLSSELRLLIESDTSIGMKNQLESWKGTQVEVKIRETKIDKMIPNMAKVYFTAKFTGKDNYTMDSVYLIVAKENDEWKISSFQPARDQKQ